MTDEDCGDVCERLAALEEQVEQLCAEVSTVTNRDVPLLKGTVRAVVGEDIEAVEAFPDAGRAFHGRVDRLGERVRTLEEQLDALGEVGAETSSKGEKFAAILTFAANKRNGSNKVALSAAEIKGCTGVSRRYAYDLMDAMAADVDGVGVREAKRVQTGDGEKRKRKALLVDCERVHDSRDGMNQFTTGGGSDAIENA